MASIDIEDLLQEVTPESPAGDNVEYAPEFGELTRAAEGKAEQSLGDSTRPAEPPDWNTVYSLSTTLLQKSKDLRLAVYMCRACLNLHGVAGFADGLSFIDKLLAKYWDSLHPQLDPDDGNDPTIRVNTIATLIDRDATLSALQVAPLVAVKGLGSFGLRHVLIAQGELSPDSDSSDAAPDMATVNAAFMEAQSNDLLAVEQSVSMALASLQSIDAQLMEKVGSSQAPNLGLLGDLFRQIENTLKDFLSKRGIVQLAKSDDAAPTSNPQAQPVEKVAGEIRSRHDAALMMDKISEYFTKNEPSSPVPLLMQRAKRVATMNFLDVLEDLAPDGLEQAKNIAGIDGA
ncbi:MAG: type VI secretion system protein TssA [Pseudomonadales bacterium]